MCHHSVQCPLCLTKITDPDEIEFVENNGMCFDCEMEEDLYEPMSEYRNQETSSLINA